MLDFIKSNKNKCMFIIAAVLLFLAFRYVIPLMYPFVIGAIFATLFSPVIRFLERKLHIGKGVGALVLMTILVLFIVILFGVCGYGLIERGYEIFCDYEKYTNVLLQRANVCCDWIESQLHMQKGYLMSEMKGTVARMSGNWQETMIPGIFEGSMSGVKKLFSVGAFLIFTFLSTILIAKEWDENRQGIFISCKKYIDKIFDFLKIFLGAQVKIISVIVLICMVGFGITGIEGGLSLSVLTACMDVLPFIGTGIILVPMLLWQLVNARYYQAFLLLATYICCIIAREYLEPKFISVKAGISPVLTLLGIYVGMKLIGFPGIFLGPLYVLLLQIFYKELIEDSSLSIDKE